VHNYVLLNDIILLLIFKVQN